MGLSPEQQAAKKRTEYLRVLMENGGHISGALRTIHRDRRTLSHWREEHEDFALLEQSILDLCVEALEAEARRRALDGIDVPITYRGEITATYKQYSDNLLMFLLKGHRPEKYRDGLHAGKNAAANLTDDELNAAIGRYLKRKGDDAAVQASEAIN